MATIKQSDDDAISICGSLSGENFWSTRRRNTCSLRFHASENLKPKIQLEIPSATRIQSGRAQSGFFKSFHHFRFVVVILSGWTFGLMMFMRNNITVSILKMVNQTHLYMLENPNSTLEDFLAEGYSLGGEFEWDNEIQHMIMSWYMFAYTIPQIASTKLASLVGSRWAMPIALSICSIACLLTPMAAYAGWKWVIVLRMLNGIGASPILPMMLVMIENWVPFEEISLGLACAQVLQTVLSAVNPLVTSYLCYYHWSYSFYVPAFITLGTCVLWLLLVTNKPDENWIISEEELIHICGCVRNNNHRHSVSHIQVDISNYKSQDNSIQQFKDTGRQIELEQKDSEIINEVGQQYSLVDILKVPSFYAFVLIWSLYCSSAASFTFTIPTYLRQFLKIGIKQNGFFCSLILTGSIFAMIWPHFLLSLLNWRFKCSMTLSRRITQLIACSVAASTWFYVAFFHEYQLFMFFINRCFHTSNDIVVTGAIMSNYRKVGLTGLAYSMVNTCGNLSVVLASTLIGYLLDYTAQSEAGWSYILWALGFTSIAQYLLFLCTNSEPVEFRKEVAKTNTINSKPPKDFEADSGKRLEVMVSQPLPPIGLDSNNNSSREDKIDIAPGLKC